MEKTFLRKTALASCTAFVLCGASSPLLAQDCDGQSVAVKGKIFNNGQAGGGFSTLGVVALNGDDPIGKMKCGIVGVARDADSGDLGPDGQPLPLLFYHTVSCDDGGTLFPGGPATHSQLTFKTKGTFTGLPSGCPAELGGGISAPFIEFSQPVPGSGRGVFTKATGGLLTIEGTLNCVGTIDMKFSGNVCLSY
jgi:hypothetical protein